MISILFHHCNGGQSKIQDSHKPNKILANWKFIGTENCSILFPQNNFRRTLILILKILKFVYETVVLCFMLV